MSKFKIPTTLRQGTASATGYQGTASATGDQGTASATGDQGTASATGYQGTASATGPHGLALSLHEAEAGEAGTLILRWWDAPAKRWRVTVGYVGEDGLEPNTKYRCEAGRLVRVATA